MSHSAQCILDFLIASVQIFNLQRASKVLIWISSLKCKLMLLDLFSSFKMTKYLTFNRNFDFAMPAKFPLLTHFILFHIQYQIFRRWKPSCVNFLQNLSVSINWESVWCQGPFLEKARRLKGMKGEKNIPEITFIYNKACKLFCQG